MLGFLRSLFSFRRKVYRLRRRYDRVREKADRTRDREKRLAVLRILDQVESTLVILEEQRISRFDRARLVRTVDAGIKQAKDILKGKYPYQRYPYEVRK